MCADSQVTQVAIQDIATLQQSPTGTFGSRWVELAQDHCDAPKERLRLKAACMYSAEAYFPEYRNLTAV